ncbi:4a-hydroxytetrahydrobiopterin dehydratase [Pseudoteredinibacter isoporae]|uniref:4a-hydroxytetrahydrobiopterin dehydratase n=1 Tax=Pseudoteredinibacter isoporae TaxID=570281 RepID=A0A7X0JYU9_9GAMM|nr:4a-hydroxytetrahydrobiopterin dehydratase [Pseudoteredinibacter isoporae]MBB6523806.1 4a-hydroxytetrahydrobiopterin dehydratase [Pseudoteredinibacter isoporae]NHO89326.1 4a-hydroxytetrahydrobiopterin dehydratase [Pseudoteredinibacter isoporae]NIB22433.1 4a-hydroxytetrahydrobiopterin dehydratase [Pseudoteredinibacter isoporae]
MSDRQMPAHDAFLFPAETLPLPVLKPYQSDEQAIAPDLVESQLLERGLSATGWQLLATAGEPLEIVRSYAFDRYLAGVSFVHCVAAAAEAVDHHPEIKLAYRRVELRWSTHFVKGIHRNDLDMAKYSDELFNALSHRSTS